MSILRSIRRLRYPPRFRRFPPPVARPLHEGCMRRACNSEDGENDSLQRGKKEKHMATIIEFYVPSTFRRKIAKQSLEYRKLIAFSLRVTSRLDDRTSSGNLLTLLFQPAALR